jgi:hypothetical protein
LPITPHIEAILDRAYTYNTEVLQSPFSTVCGHYCCFFLLKRCEGLTFNEIISLFSENTLINDNIVEYYIKERMKQHQNYKQNRGTNMIQYCHPLLNSICTI